FFPPPPRHPRFAAWVVGGVLCLCPRTTTTAPTATRPSVTTSRTTTATRPASTTSRAATTSRTASNPTTSRAASATASRSARTPRTTTATTAAARSASVQRPARAATSNTIISSNTFGSGYNACRDAYFTCMDQFCAQQNETYRRCVCSARLTDIQAQERLLSQTANQLQDFKDLNIEVIPKTAAEVKAMLNASAGEAAASTIRDTSAGASALAGISEVLTKTKNKSLSTQGQLDIAGDINAIWATTDLASGANLANLTGEALYNAVHSQCADLIADACESSATFNMVVSAYGMYIENDCTALATALDKKTNAASGTVRETEREMNLARLENYNAHNSTTIHNCIAQVRADITADTACGKDYVHCLDISGRYLNRDTGEPIYTADFYQLEAQLSLSGDILTNQANRLLVAELNRKKIFAERGLDTCRDLADDVWDEFVRQAVTEIYQGQQERIRQVKTECLEVVNNCYDEQSKSLKDFSNVKEQLLLGSRLELSEQMCQEKLDACSNLYGGGPDGLQMLVVTMRGITDQKIAKECKATLQEFARDMCAPPKNDSLHGYPFACRVYAPGDQRYAQVSGCNKTLTSVNGGNTGGTGGTGGGGTSTPTPGTSGYTCPTYKKYNSCKPGYYMTYNSVYNGTPQAGNKCTPCPANYTCPGGTADRQLAISTPDDTTSGPDCGDDYIGSLYQKMVRYALQVCVRPSNTSDVPDSVILQDVNVVMDSVRTEMAQQLSTECDRLGGLWVDTQWKDVKTTTDQGIETDGGDGIHDVTGHQLHKRFYSETGANTKWGYCAANSVEEAIEEPETPATSGTGTGTGTGGDDITTPTLPDSRG
ncbi:MAG: hypothetical protein K2L94_01685, partial [Alphaproteobacteria bacterium]|nr:hypothetical protein [Alphaproteobacteria bacterium]